MCRDFGKGSMIAVDGQLQSRTYQAKDGSNRYVIEVVADQVSFTGERRDNSNNFQQNYNQQNYSQQSNNNQQNAAPQQQQMNGFTEMPTDDDLPF